MLLEKKVQKILRKIKGENNAAKRVKIKRAYRRYCNMFSSVVVRNNNLSESERLEKRAKSIVEKAGIFYDEHDSWKSGDYRITSILDFVLPDEAKKPPFLDTGKKGLVLVEVERVRRYYDSRYKPSVLYLRYLCGRNEDGTYFSHGVSKNCNTVREAVSWIWGGKENDIIVRQGDIAIVAGRSRKMTLPRRHTAVEQEIVHPSHPAIRMPVKNEYILVGRRSKQTLADDID